MRFLRYLFAFWTAFAVYSLFTFAYGPGSLQVQKLLEEEIGRLSGNLDELELTHRKFLNTAASLETDGETLSIYARQLGYGHPGEKFIRIIGQENTVNPEIFLGRVLQAAEPEFVPDVKTKVLALAFALAVLVFFIAVDLLSLKGRYEST